MKGRETLSEGRCVSRKGRHARFKPRTRLITNIASDESRGPFRPELATEREHFRHARFLVALRTLQISCPVNCFLVRDSRNQSG